MLNNFLLVIPLLAILAGIGFSFDSAFAEAYTLDYDYCKSISGDFYKEGLAKICELNKNIMEKDDQIIYLERIKSNALSK